MSTTQAPAPTIRNAGFTPKVPHKLFVNIRITDLQRSIDFFEALGFTFNTHFTDATATCMLVGEDAYFMLLTPEKFASFSKLPAHDPRTSTAAFFALSVDSRAAVDEMMRKAIAAGGAPAEEPQDHGFMYGQAFYDLDGHVWEVFWMDPNAIPSEG